MKSVKTLLTIMLLTLFVGTVDAKEINVYMVYSEKCRYCQSAKAFFEEYTKDNKNIKLYKYNALDESTMDEIEIIEETINKNLTSVPLIVIGEKFLTGFNSTKEKQIKDTIKDYQKNVYYDPVGEALGVKSKDALDKKVEDNTNDQNDDTSNIVIDDPVKELISEPEKESIFKKYGYQISISVLIILLVVLEIIKRKPSKD